MIYELLFLCGFRCYFTKIRKLCEHMISKIREVCKSKDLVLCIVTEEDFICSNGYKIIKSVMFLNYIDHAMNIGLLCVKRMDIYHSKSGNYSDEYKIYLVVVSKHFLLTILKSANYIQMTTPIRILLTEKQIKDISSGKILEKSIISKLTGTEILSLEIMSENRSWKASSGSSSRSGGR